MTCVRDVRLGNCHMSWSSGWHLRRKGWGEATPSMGNFSQLFPILCAQRVLGSIWHSSSLFRCTAQKRDLFFYWQGHFWQTGLESWTDVSFNLMVFISVFFAFCQKELNEQCMKSLSRHTLNKSQRQMLPVYIFSIRVKQTIAMLHRKAQLSLFQGHWMDL